MKIYLLSLLLFSGVASAQVIENSNHKSVGDRFNVRMKRVEAYCSKGSVVQERKNIKDYIVELYPSGTYRATISFNDMDCMYDLIGQYEAGNSSMPFPTYMSARISNSNFRCKDALPIDMVPIQADLKKDHVVEFSPRATEFYFVTSRFNQQPECPAGEVFIERFVKERLATGQKDSRMDCYETHMNMSPPNFVAASNCLH